jgi:hypothetical protein
MPYIRVIDGVMQEFDSNDHMVGPVQSIGLNAYAYLDKISWTKTGTPSVGWTYQQDFPNLRAKGISYIQVMLAPFAGGNAAAGWPTVVGMPDFNDDNSVADLHINFAYWDIVGGLLDMAMQQRLGVIACVFWNMKAIATMVGEMDPVDPGRLGVQVVDPNSKTRQYMRAFATAFATHFGEHRGIAGWMAQQELGNWLAPEEADGQFTYAVIGDIVRETAVAIRAGDRLGRMISSGNNGPLHATMLPFTADDWIRDILPLTNPDPVDTISENLFLGTPFVSSARPYEETDPGIRRDFTTSSLAYLQLMQAAAARLGKPYYVASFGLNGEDEAEHEDSGDQIQLKAFLDNLALTGTQLACLWQWNGRESAQNPAEPKQFWNVFVASGAPAVRAPVFGAIATKLDERPQHLQYPRLNWNSWAPRRPPFDTVLDLGHMGRKPGATNGRNGLAIAALGSNTGAFSASFWLYQTAFPDEDFAPFISYQENSGSTLIRGWAVTQSSNRLFLTIGTGSASANFGVNLAGPLNVLNRWVHCTFTVQNGRTVAFYADHFLVFQSTSACTFENNTTQPLLIGRRPGSSAGTPQFQLSDLIIYDRALTPREIFEYGAYGKVVGTPLGRWCLDGDLSDAIGARGDLAPTGDQSLPGFKGI